MDAPNRAQRGAATAQAPQTALENLELLDDETLLAGVADDDALEQQEGMLLRMEVEQVVGDLCVAVRQLLALRYERDLTQPEVARMLGIPEGTVEDPTSSAPWAVAQGIGRCCMKPYSDINRFHN